MNLEKRAVFGWPASGAGSANPRSGIAVHYDGSNQSLANKQHASCRTYWKNTRKFHMGPSRGWADIGYSFAVCPHGIVLEGRGLNKVQAAQPGGNSTWYSVTFMSGPSEHPTDAQIKAFRELRSWLRGKGVAAAIRPHSAFTSTSCCGDILRKLISNGTLAAGAPSTSKPADPQEDDDMQPSTKFEISDYWKGRGEFSHETYDAGFLWAGAVSETRTYGKKILAQLTAQNETIKELSAAIAALSKGREVDPDELVRRIEAAIENITIRLDVADDTV